MALQLSWNLDQTSTSTIQIAKGLLHAATTDNVQPLAIMACEQFGNTLAVSRDALRKIEHCVVPTPQPAILTFLKSTVGYSKNDCASYFARSLAGLQFLALAAALVTYEDQFGAAEALQDMLVSTAKDKTLVPTVRQVKDLLTSIEPRCHGSGFADEVMGWQLLLPQHLKNIGNSGSPKIGYLSPAPSREALGNLVNALRQLNRVGDADTTTVTVRTSRCAAWTIAFVKWSLGYPPSVVSCDTGVHMPVLDQPESKVTVFIPSNEGDENLFSIIIYSSIHNPSELVAAGPDSSTRGTMSLQSYGRASLQDCSFDSGVGREAFREAVPHCLRKVMRQFSRSPMYDFQNREREEMHINRVATYYNNARRLSPFRGQNAICNIYELLFDERLDVVRPEDEVIRLSDLPHVALVLKECQQGTCGGSHPRGSIEGCQGYYFYTELVAITLDLLALSLFDCPDLLQVSTNALHDGRHHNSLTNEVTKFLRDLKYLNIGVSDLMVRAMEISGHDTDRLRAGEWVISSAKGQAVWPTIYETLQHADRGFLSLSWHPGVIIHHGEIYNLAIHSPSAPKGRDPVTGISQVQVQMPRNLCPALDLDWMVSRGEKTLHVKMGIRRGSDHCFFLGCDAFGALEALKRALTVSQCFHNTNAELRSSNLGLRFTGPINPLDPEAEISVVAVNGNDGLRLSALCMLNRQDTGTVVLRNRACLECCLEVCRKTDSKVLIL